MDTNLYIGIGAIALAAALGWYLLGRFSKRRDDAAGTEVVSTPLEGPDEYWPEGTQNKPAHIPATPDVVLPASAADVSATPASESRAPTGYILDVSEDHPGSSGIDTNEGPTATTGPTGPEADLSPAMVERKEDPISRARAYEDSQNGLDQVQAASDAKAASAAEDGPAPTMNERLEAMGVPVPTRMRSAGPSVVEDAPAAMTNEGGPDPEKVIETGDAVQAEPLTGTMPGVDPVTPVPEAVLPDPTKVNEPDAPVVAPVVDPAPVEPPKSAYAYANREQLIAAVQAYKLPGRTKVDTKAHQYRNLLKTFVDEAWAETEPSIKSTTVPWVKSVTTGTDNDRHGGDYVYWVHLHFVDGFASPVKIKLATTKSAETKAAVVS